MFNTIVPPILLGIQAGGRMAPHTAAARISNILLLIFKASYALYGSILLPFIDVPMMVAELSSAWLETVVCACLVGLQWRETHDLGDTMMGCEVMLVALQVVTMFVNIVLPCLENVYRWLRRKWRREEAARSATTTPASSYKKLDVGGGGGGKRPSQKQLALGAVAATGGHRKQGAIPSPSPSASKA